MVDHAEHEGLCSKVCKRSCIDEGCNADFEDDLMVNAFESELSTGSCAASQRTRKKDTTCAP